MNQLWGYLIIAESIRNGVDYFVISPGSRSTPLTVAVAQHPQARQIVCLDERGAAFHAIGYARATGNPAVLICTSGTAAANYLPAVIEAAMDNLPLIILSGDRPPELRQTGANQTIQQVNLYGDYICWQGDLPCPTAEINPHMVLTTIDLAISRSRQAPGGAIHLNCMFREPLAPLADIPLTIPPSLAKWQESGLPYTRYSQQLTIPDPLAIAKVIETISSSKAGILAIGLLKSPREIDAAITLAARLNWAVFADVQSGLRLRQDFPNLIHYFDRLLITDRVAELARVDTIVQLGTRIVSAQWLKWLEKSPPLNYLVVANNLDRHDPNHIVSQRISSDLVYFCQQLTQQLPLQSPAAWVQQLRVDSDRIGLTITNFLATPQLTEPTISRTISELLPPEHGLWIGNSMPIRDLDMYGVGAILGATSPRIGANRATSGIEGAIASATGFAAGLQAPVTAIVGDLSSLHDLNSLALLQSDRQPVIVIIINNDGGGIFSFLPIANSIEIFEPYFGTPHGFDFKNAAAMFKLAYYHPQNRDALIDDYLQALTTKKSAIIEVTTNRTDNLQIHQELIKLCHTISDRSRS
jgi:2-succinyl-5-enolpyruvyl-6-hydroxy-3-cyclohexene-1-carboxylate synthase